MAYSDEWWKGKYGAGTGCPDNNPAFHGTCGYVTTSHPDGYANEEWWGIMRTKDNSSSSDIMEPRAVYYRLQSIWLPQNKLTVTKSGTGTVTSNPSGISCGSDCSEPYNYNTVVTLTATPATGSTFASWSGCTPTPSDPKKCTATVLINT